MNTPHGKSVIVTGGSRGIGLAAAEAFASVGCNLAITGQKETPRLLETAAEIAAKHNVRAIGIGADVADSKAIRGAVRRAAEALGGLDIAVMNAGICEFKPIMDVTDGDWLKHVGVNFNGAFYAAQETARVMLGQGRGGRIIFTGSVGAFRSNATQTHYCATKGGMHLLMQGLALELAPHGINVNAVAPGWIHTDINDEMSREPELTAAWIKANCPVGRLGGVEDLKGAYLLLGSKEASYINGSTITVDGGWMAQL